MKRILIINSDEDTMLLLEKWLNRKNFEVEFTNDPKEVNSLIDAFNPDLILIDIAEKELIPSIKSHDTTLPLLLMTGYAYRGSYSDLPVDNIIEKPFSLELLQNKINKITEKAFP